MEDTSDFTSELSGPFCRNRFADSPNIYGVITFLSCSKQRRFNVLRDPFGFDIVACINNEYPSLLGRPKWCERIVCDIHGSQYGVLYSHRFAGLVRSKKTLRIFCSLGFFAIRVMVAAPDTMTSMAS